MCEGAFNGDLIPCECVEPVVVLVPRQYHGISQFVREASGGPKLRGRPGGGVCVVVLVVVVLGAARPAQTVGVSRVSGIGIQEYAKNHFSGVRCGVGDSLVVAAGSRMGHHGPRAIIEGEVDVALGIGEGAVDGDFIPVRRVEPVVVVIPRQHHGISHLFRQAPGRPIA